MCSSDLAQQGRTPHPKAIAIALAQAAQSERRAGLQQALGCGFAQRKERRKISDTSGPFGQMLEQSKLDTGCEDLRVDKPGAQIKESLGLTSGNVSKDRKSCGKALKTSIHYNAVTPIQQGIGKDHGVKQR